MSHVICKYMQVFEKKKKKRERKNAFQSDIIKIVFFNFEKQIPFSMP